jgi:hypothetical protein
MREDRRHLHQSLRAGWGKQMLLKRTPRERASAYRGGPFAWKRCVGLLFAVTLFVFLLRFSHQSF